MTQETVLQGGSRDRRIWHGWTRPENTDRYERLLKEEIFPGITKKGFPGYRGIRLFRGPIDDSEVEFVTVMRFDPWEAVGRFSGEDHGAGRLRRVAGRGKACGRRWTHHLVTEFFPSRTNGRLRHSLGRLNLPGKELTRMEILLVLSSSFVPLRAAGYLRVARLGSWRNAGLGALAIMFLVTSTAHFTGMKHDLAEMMPEPLPDWLWHHLPHRALRDRQSRWAA